MFIKSIIMECHVKFFFANMSVVQYQIKEFLMIIFGYSETIILVFLNDSIVRF